MAEPQSRRKYKRIPARAFVLIDQADDQAAQLPAEGETTDFSEGGVFVSTPETFPLGTTVELDIILADELEHLRITGVVRRVRTEEPAGIGVEIVRASDRHRTLLASFLEKTEKDLSS